MSCRTCLDCGISYPPAETFRMCPACGEGTKYRPLYAHDMHWEAKASAIAARIAEVVTEELREIPHIDAPIRLDEEGLHWVSSHDAIRSGCTLNLAEQEVISVNDPLDSPNGPDGNLYEVIAYVDSKRAYWIRPLVVPDYVP